MKNLPAEAGFILLIVVIILIIFFIIFMKIFGDKLEKKTSKNKISRGTKQSKLFITNSLPVVFWGFFIGGNIFFNMIMHFSKDEFLGFLLLIHFIWIAFSVYLIFRNAEIFKQQKIKNKENYGQATAAKIATVLIVLAGIGNLMMTMRNL
jgi:protein-S-isoprenylcysteine O-methyltransferase Ste14